MPARARIKPCRPGQGGVARHEHRRHHLAPGPGSGGSYQHRPLHAEAQIDSLEALHQRSIQDLDWYWNAVQEDLSWRWLAPFSLVVDLSRGVQWPRWFVGGR